MFYLDTNVVIDAIRGKYSILEEYFKKYSSSEIAIPAIVVAELEFGAQNSDNYEKRKNQYLKIIEPYKIIPFSKKEAAAYGTIREQLTKDGNIIGSNDMLIAATAMANGATLVTHNTDEFSRVNGLVIEDWRI